MKRIIIIGEGQTEQEFCNEVLQPHFNRLGIYIQNPVIKKTKGGIVPWASLKHQIETHLLEDQTVFVTTLIDYYGIYEHHKYPGWDEAERLKYKARRIDLIETAMRSDIRDELRIRFIPYIQLHEFEGLVFCDIDVFNNSFEEDELDDYAYLVETIEHNPNPELINNDRETAPSKRLERIIKGYKSENENNKIFYGALLTHDIGLTKIRQKCPRFNNWITKLETV